MCIYIYKLKSYLLQIVSDLDSDKYMQPFEFVLHYKL